MYVFCITGPRIQIEAYFGIHFVDEYLIYSNLTYLFLFFNSRRLHQKQKRVAATWPFFVFSYGDSKTKKESRAFRVSVTKLGLSRQPY